MPESMRSMTQRQAHIVVDGPGHEGTVVSLKEGITSLGRLPSNDVILVGDLVSRHHARILFFDGKASLQDLGSHNGSWVNGERISTRPIKDGDLARIGNFRVRLKQGPADEASAPPDREASRRRRRPSNAALELPSSRGADIPALDTLTATPAIPTVPPEAPSVADVPALPDDVQTRDPAQSMLVQEIDRLRSGETGRVTDTDTLMLMFRVTDALAQASSVREYLTRVLEIVTGLIPADTAAFYRLVPGASTPERLADTTASAAEPEVSTSVLRWAIAKNYTVFSKDLSADLRFSSGRSVMMMTDAGQALVCAPVTIDGKPQAALYMSRPASSPFHDSHVDAIEAVAHLSSTAIHQIEARGQAIEQRMAEQVLARHHPPDIVERLVEAAQGPPSVPGRGLEGKTSTVCVCHVQGLDSLADQRAADEITRFASEYIERMSSIVFAHRGTMTRASGLGLVTVFGLPFAAGDDAGRAVDATLEMRAAVDALISTCPSIGPHRMRAAICTGWLLGGLVGWQLEYTLLGEALSAAERMLPRAAPGAIVIDAQTEALVRDRIQLEPAGRQPIPGKRDPVELFEVVGAASP